jgi:hypothetical protein
MLEVLSDVAVQVQSDSSGQTWYLGRVMAVQDMSGKSWQNRSHPVDPMLSPVREGASEMQVVPPISRRRPTDVLFW